MLADGGHDDHKHDPVGNVHKAEGHNCPSIKWPFFCSAAGEGGREGGEREKKRGREGREREREREGGRERGMAVIKCAPSKLKCCCILYLLTMAVCSNVDGRVQQ